MNKIAHAALLATTLAIAGALPDSGTAQSKYSAAISVNDRAITYFEIEQRRLFMQALRTPGNLEKEARKALIEDRLKLQAAAAAGLSVSDEGLTEGLKEFAARANLTTELFVVELAKEGVALETFREFVRAGLVWREVVRTRFGPRSQITEGEVDRAMALAGGRASARILLSEIVIPMPPGSEDDIRALANELSQTLRTQAEFSAAAQQYSAAPTGPAGGKLEWLPLSNLPAQIAPILLTLNPGDVTDPVPLGNAIALFQMRALDERRVEPPRTISVDYATVLIPGGRSEAGLKAATDLADQVDTCDDLYGVVDDLPPEYFTRAVTPMGDVPRDVALELAKLDADEISTLVTRQDGQFLVFLMLCGRTSELAEGAREDVRRALFNQRLVSYADSYLAELRADAIITER